MTGFWMRHCALSVVMACGLVLPLDAVGWRYDGTGRFPGTNPPLRWSKDANVSWKVALPGKSLASPVVVGKRVFVMSDPAELLCLSTEDGQTIWQRSHEYSDVFGDAKGREIEDDLKLAESVRKEKEALQRERNEAKKAGNDEKQEQLQTKIEALQERYTQLTGYPPKPGGDTGNSTSTVVSDGRNIFAVFSTGIVSSHSLDGKRNWIIFIEGARGDHSASPLLVDGKLIVHLREVVALNPQDGSIVWRVNSDERHGSPVAARVGKDSVLVTATGDVIRASDGAFIAKRQFQLGHNSPIIEEGVIYSMEDGAAKAFQLPRTLERETKLDVQWERSSSRASQLASPIYHDELLYSVTERGILTVMDAKSGEEVYRKRLQFGGGRVDASLCLAGGFLFISNTRGKTLVLRPGREFSQVAENDLEGFSSSLAFSKNQIYIRTSRFLICVGNRDE